MYNYSDPDEQNQNLRREAALLFGLKFQQDSFMKMKENIKLISEKSWLVRFKHNYLF